LHILLTGLDHNTAPIELRERVSFTQEHLPDALPALAAQVGEGVILSTCNRTEVYTVSDEPADAARDIRRFVADYHGLDYDTLGPHLYDRTDADAVTHLFRVASGLESMILGESQILGQVRVALTAASESSSLSSVVSRLFHGALRTGRRVREDTHISRNALSVSYAGVQLAQRVLGTLSGLRVLLIGAGEAGQLVARALRTSGANDLMIANRTPQRSEELARSLDGRAIPFKEIGLAVGDADVVIAATGASSYVLTRDDFASAPGTPNRRSQVLIDLSVPRNIDPEAATVDGISLYNIDDLSTIAEENLQGRRESAADAEAIVTEHVAHFMEWWGSLKAIPIIKEMRQRADLTRKRELARAIRKLPNLSAEDLETLDAMTQSIVNRVLHDPTVSLKQLAGEAHLRAARDLFRLKEERG
jgi:glutamyl-tRNA reductase